MVEDKILPRIGAGTEENPFRPDTTATHWIVLEDYGDAFLVRVWEE